ncbi:ABC transporter permease [Persicitalea jodogahamensis]|uniref:Macrolide ABC transporter permease n=1 Tax=Persicitalea jodogahamensis TaxID=402147 RepID=A0A8J3DAX1_9BACT|nr:ABC transporter permease [Persicitalea jodogahamensis]GHB76527.1 macrolide ABC transporter permease [Persicitalea jodogahamensis]
MWKKILISFSSAINTIRSRFFHTVLSVLGIVIGVASLVGILSLIDGMEQYANEQISKTTSLKAIVIYNKPDKVVNGIRVRKDSFPLLSYQQINRLHSNLSLPVDVYMLTRQGREVTMQGDTQRIGTMISGALPQLAPKTQFIRGKSFTNNDLNEQRPVAVVNETFVRRMPGNTQVPDLIGKKVQVGQQVLTIVGITKSDTATPAQLYFPISLLSVDDLQTMRLDYGLEAENVEDVPALKAQVLAWIARNVPNGKDDFEVFTNEFRVEQAAQGFLIFRVIMGFIVGISVLVGGIGVMNVLLISVSERTSEIGVRKAVGAKKQDIVLQFLSESVTISVFGSLLGLLLGIGGTLIIVPIVKAVAKAPFQAAFTLNTMLVISVVAVLIGIVFGTYPALRAARLDPVEAIRRE